MRIRNQRNSENDQPRRKEPPSTDHCRVPSSIFYQLDLTSRALPKELSPTVSTSILGRFIQTRLLAWLLCLRVVESAKRTLSILISQVSSEDSHTWPIIPSFAWTDPCVENVSSFASPPRHFRVQLLQTVSRWLLEVEDITPLGQLKETRTTFTILWSDMTAGSSDPHMSPVGNEPERTL